MRARDGLRPDGASADRALGAYRLRAGDVAREEWAEHMRALRGESYSELDEDGNVVIRPAQA